MTRLLTWPNGQPRRPVYHGEKGRILDRTFREWKSVKEASTRTLPLLAELAAAASGDHREVLFAHLSDLTAAIDDATRSVPANDGDDFTPTDPAASAAIPHAQELAA